MNLTVPSLWKVWHLLSICLITFPPHILLALHTQTQTHTHMGAGGRALCLFCTSARHTRELNTLLIPSKNLFNLKKYADRYRPTMKMQSLFLEEEASYCAKWRRPNIAPGVFNASQIRAWICKYDLPGLSMGVLHCTTAVFRTLCGWVQSSLLRNPPPMKGLRFKQGGTG